MGTVTGTDFRGRVFCQENRRTARLFNSSGGFRMN